MKNSILEKNAILEKMVEDWNKDAILDHGTEQKSSKADA